MALSAIRSAHRRAIRIGRLQDFLGLGKDAINKVQLSRVLREFIALAEKDRHTFGGLTLVRLAVAGEPIANPEVVSAAIFLLASSAQSDLRMRSSGPGCASSMNSLTTSAKAAGLAFSFSGGLPLLAILR
jgi:hypothetical protein